MNSTLTYLQGSLEQIGSTLADAYLRGVLPLHLVPTRDLSTLIGGLTQRRELDAADTVEKVWQARHSVTDNMEALDADDLMLYKNDDPDVDLAVSELQDKFARFSRELCTFSQDQLTGVISHYPNWSIFFRVANAELRRRGLPFYSSTSK